MSRSENRGRGLGQHSHRPSPVPSFFRGGSNGGRRGGYSRGEPAQHLRPSSSTPAAPAAQAAASMVPAHQTVPSVSSSDPESLSRDLEVQLSLNPCAVAAPPPSSSKNLRLPTRPGYGRMGNMCYVRANYFPVHVADIDIHHYDVSIHPEVTSKKINRLIMKELIDVYKEKHMGGLSPAYDGRESIYTVGPLPFQSEEFKVELIEGGSARNRSFHVAIKLASRPGIYRLKQYLASRQLESPQEILQALDVVLRTPPTESDKKFTVVGRSFFSNSLIKGQKLGDGTEIWMGYYQSLRPTQIGLCLNVDISARSFYESILVTDFVAKHFGLKDLSRPLRCDQDRLRVKKALKGVKVEVMYGRHPRTYKITDITKEPLYKLTFNIDDKKSSVVDYFHQAYNINLRYTALPAIQAGTEAKPVYLPMEFCKIAEGQRYTKKLDEKQVNALLSATCQRPDKRELEIKKMVKLNDFNSHSLVNNEFGIEVKGELPLVKARVLPPPTKLINGGKVDSWACVNFSKMGQGNTSEFCAELVNVCKINGMEFNPNPIISIRSAEANQIEQALLAVRNESMARLNRQLQLLIIILPESSGSYGKIKRICETELGIVSQCCQYRHASRPSRQYLANLSLKINVKVGGRNTVLVDAIQKRFPFETDQVTIIFGADVTHPLAGEDSSPSIAAVVASMDWPELTKYRTLVSAQPPREEIILDLYRMVQDPAKGTTHDGMIRDHLIAFYRSNGQRKPQRIIFYRDGVSEGQFSQVLLYEVDAIRKACNSLEIKYLPPITFVVVQKRHHTRLFPAGHNSDRSGNILPGTVVDTKICHPTEFDFYLSSHAGIQGTSKPAHYHVLYDENGFSADHLQVLTNSLCYTYARCTRSVSIVPPAYYAHLAAFRARCYIESGPSETGSSGVTRQRNEEVAALPRIKDNVRDVMFFC